MFLQIEIASSQCAPDWRNLRLAETFGQADAGVKKERAEHNLAAAAFEKCRSRVGVATKASVLFGRKFPDSDQMCTWPPEEVIRLRISECSDAGAIVESNATLADSGG